MQISAITPRVGNTITICSPRPDVLPYTGDEAIVIKRFHTDLVGNDQHTLYVRHASGTIIQLKSYEAIPNILIEA